MCDVLSWDYLPLLWRHAGTLSSNLFSPQSFLPHAHAAARRGHATLDISSFHGNATPPLPTDSLKETNELLVVLLISQ